jgi:hypothetical protein
MFLANWELVSWRVRWPAEKRPGVVQGALHGRFGRRASQATARAHCTFLLAKILRDARQGACGQSFGVAEETHGNVGGRHAENDRGRGEGHE